jgi:mono/diheme cytochrome c family protein
MVVKEKGTRELAREVSGQIGAASLIGLAFWVSALVLFPAALRGAQDGGVKAQLSEKETVGKRIFYQRCSFCHLGMPTKYQTYAPVLQGDRIAELGDDAVREKIKDGSVAMPGFKYSLKSDEFDSIVAYLKTVKREDVVHKSSKQ